jgi:hypothetical protein
MSRRRSLQVAANRTRARKSKRATIWSRISAGSVHTAGTVRLTGFLGGAHVLACRLFLEGAMACPCREIDPRALPVVALTIYLPIFLQRKKEGQVEPAIDQNQVESNK